MPFKDPEYFEQLSEDEIQKLCLAVAAQSIAHKRKVGAVIATASGHFIASGFNHNPITGFCEDEEGNTLPDVIHAEAHAIHKANATATESSPMDMKNCILYVTHEPCKGCDTLIKEQNFNKVVIVKSFMKFDKGKLQYDLIPPSALEGLAEVLTYGAKKYKPNNWRNAEDLGQYRSAAFRHFEAYRNGEWLDQESGLPHLACVMTNLAFLLELEDKPVTDHKEK